MVRSAACGASRTMKAERITPYAIALLAKPKKQKAGVAAGFRFDPPFCLAHDPVRKPVPTFRDHARWLRARSVRGFQFRFLPCNGALDRGLHLLEGADLDLPHAFAGDAEFGGKIFQRHRVLRKAPRLEDAAFARVEHADRAVQSLAAVIEFLAL